MLYTIKPISVPTKPNDRANGARPEDNSHAITQVRPRQQSSTHGGGHHYAAQIIVAERRVTRVRVNNNFAIELTGNQTLRVRQSPWSKLSVDANPVGTVRE